LYSARGQNEKETKHKNHWSNEKVREVNWNWVLAVSVNTATLGFNSGVK